MAELAARVTHRDAALDTLVGLGFVYPDATDFRTRSTSGNAHVSVRGSTTEPSSALPNARPDRGPTNEPTTSVSR